MGGGCGGVGGGGGGGWGGGWRWHDCICAEHIATCKGLRCSTPHTYVQRPPLQHTPHHRCSSTNHRPKQMLQTTASCTPSITGERWHFGALATRLAQAGLVVAVPSYTLYPRAVALAMAGEVAEALLWISAHADSFGGDAAAVSVLGHSAGAHLGALALLSLAQAHEEAAATAAAAQQGSNLERRHTASSSLARAPTRSSSSSSSTPTINDNNTCPPPSKNNELPPATPSPVPRIRSALSTGRFGRVHSFSVRLSSVPESW